MKLKNVVLGLIWVIVTQSAFAANVALTTITKNGEGESLLADSIGKTLYVFDPDQGSNTSVCTGDCAEVWPPCIISAGEAKVLASPLSFVNRANGKMQLTYEGRPVYTYMLDRVAGNDLGDGIGGVWHYIELEEASSVK